MSEKFQKFILSALGGFGNEHFSFLFSFCLNRTYCITTWRKCTSSNQCGPQGQLKEGGLMIATNPTLTTGLIVQYGNVGIGTTTPSYKLNIVGDVRWSGTFQGGSVP
jgi:hypothetical protein